MKTSIIRIFLLLILSSSAVFSQKYRQYTDEKSGFSISYPKHWKQIYQPKKGPVKFVASLTRDGYVPASIILNICENRDYSIDTVFYYYVKGIMMGGEKILDSGESNINGQNYYWFTSLIDNEWEYIKALHYITVKDKREIIVSFRANKASRFSEFEKYFLEIINSLSIK